jgi:hypothetical protein
MNPYEELMPRKASPPPAALLAPVGQAPEDYKAMIARIVNERIAEILADSQAAELQPFFDSPEVNQAMRRRQNVIERRKWNWYWEEFGCLICQDRKGRHVSLGMCDTCFCRTRGRLLAIKKRHAPEVPQEFHDTVELARKALMPSIEKLAKQRRGK